MKMEMPLDRVMFEQPHMWMNVEEYTELLGCLNPRHFEVLKMTHLERRSITEVSEKLGVTEKNARHLIRYAKSKLKRTARKMQAQGQLQEVTRDMLIWI